MRISQQMLSRNYLGRMGRNLKTLTQSNEKMASGRKFNKGYENVTDAGKALKIRKLIVDNERYQTTVRDARGRAAAAEDSLRGVTEILTRAKDRAVEGMNETMAPEDRQKIATELSRLQDEVFQIMNGRFNDKYIFDAAGNGTGTQPFTQAESGKLMYNGTIVGSMSKSPSTGKPQVEKMDENGVFKPTPIPYNKENYVDIGSGFLLRPDGTVDPNTAHKDTFSGVESFGYGVNRDGVPINAHSLLGNMVDALNRNDTEGLGKALNGIDDSMEFLLTSITEIGTRGVVLEDTAGRLDNEYENLLATQNELEGIDLSEEIINNKSYEMSWMVTLQLGSKILPQTIFDFLR